MIGALLGGIGSILGGMGGASAQAKTAQNQTALEQFRAELAGRIAQANQGNTRAASIRSAPGARLGQATQGNLAQEWTSPKVSWGGAGTMPSVTGGVGSLGTSSIMRDIGERNQADALSRSQAGQNATDVAPEFVMPTAPKMSSSSWLDKLIGYGGAAATGAGELMGAFGKTPTYTNNPDEGMVTGPGIEGNLPTGWDPSPDTQTAPTDDIYNQFLEYMATQRKQPGQ